MNNYVPHLLLSTVLISTLPSVAHAQGDDGEALKIAAVEALLVAPPEKALPVIQTLLQGDSSDEVKSRALFVLGQLGLPEANATLIDFAKNAGGDLQLEAIRTIGISGDPELTSQLGALYDKGDPAT